MSRRPASGDDVFDEPAFAVRPTGDESDVFAEPSVAPRRAPPSVAGTAEEVWEEPGAPPPPAAAAGTTHRDRIATAWRAAAAAPMRRAAALLALLAFSGALAVGCAILQESTMKGSVLGAIVFAPIVEELAKSFGVLLSLERRPWLLGGTASILLVNAVSGLAFAVTENLLYLHLYIDEPTAGTILVRWFGCTALHAGCSLIASVGLARSWREAAASLGPARIERAVPWLVAAMVAHGLWNAGATLEALFFAGS